MPGLVRWRPQDKNGVGCGVFSLCQSRPIDLIPFLFRVWGWGKLPDGGRREPLLFRAERAKTNQPSVAATAAERRPGYGIEATW